MNFCTYRYPARIPRGFERRPIAGVSKHSQLFRVVNVLVDGIYAEHTPFMANLYLSTELV